MAGIYIHIPFCKQNCTYCDFYFSLNKKHEKDFFNALGAELALRKREMLAERIETIYFGGGTPSYASPQETDRILNWIFSNLHVNPNAEITLEANPEDLITENLFAWKNAGINRLSIGVQTFEDKFLQLLNRSHNAQQVFSGLENTIQTGFTNLTIDLIYGIPGMNLKTWEKQLDIFLQFQIPHLSAYALTVEPKTLLEYQIKTQKLNMPNEETFEKMFFVMTEKLTKEGFNHYEISNFARPGFESKHNKSYWEGKIYFGFGPSAHSYDGNKTRRQNLPNLFKYINGIKTGNPWYETEVLTEKNLYNEKILTLLRLRSGINEKTIKRDFPQFYPDFIQTSEYLIEQGLIEKSGAYYFIPAHARFLTDGIIEKFILV